MGEFIRHFALAFVSIFVAVDAPGILPLYESLVEDMEPAARRKVVYQSMITAMSVAIVFMFLGKGLTRAMGVTEFDLMVAGGAILFIIAAVDLISGRKYARTVATVGAVPLGTPLIVGPAVLTSTLILLDAHGILPTLAAIILNILLAGAILLAADVLTRILGPAGSKVLSKVSMLILAAFAVMLVRKGLAGIAAGLSAAASQPAPPT